MGYSIRSHDETIMHFIFGKQQNETEKQARLPHFSSYMHDARLCTVTVMKIEFIGDRLVASPLFTKLSFHDTINLKAESALPLCSIFCTKRAALSCASRKM